jgi:hypothetical protein
MSVQTIVLKETTTETIANQVQDELSFEPSFVIFFASSQFDVKSMSANVKQAVPNSKVMGCTTSGELASGEMMDGSVVLMAFSSEMIDDVKIEVIEGIKNNVINLNQAIRNFEEHFGESMMDMSLEEYVGLVLIDGMSMAEERVVDKLGDTTNVLFVGGSAGDDMKFETTHLFVDGKVYTDAVVLALFKPKRPFSIIKTQSFKTTGEPFVVTKVNEESREVLEFNGVPAVQFYADFFGVKKEEVADLFMKHPVGLVADDEIYVRSPQRIHGDSIVFYCNLLEGMEVQMLESTDILKDTKKAIEDKESELGEVSAIINFNCILRTLDMKSQGITREYGQLFSDIPTVGFSTYGEALLGHINQTATMLVLK